MERRGGGAEALQIVESYPAETLLLARCARRDRFSRSYDAADSSAREARQQIS
jgi:hypothetical protein